MKTKYSLMSGALILCASVLTIGCSSGGGSGGGSSGAVSAATTVVSGTTGSGSGGATTTGAFTAQFAPPTDSGDSAAVLIVDKNGDGILDESDYIYTTAVLTDGSFSFDNVTVDETKPTKAQLTVAKVGYAPVVKTIILEKDSPLSINAVIGSKPLLTQVVTLPATGSDRANTFLKFGLTSTNGSLSSFSKLMTLSELKAEDDLGLGEGTLTEASIPTSAFASDVTTVTVDMQAFDSTDADDIAHFPGSFSGHGKPSIGSTATGDDGENALESAAFDLIKLTDQNGNNIDLQTAVSSKLSTTDASSCTGMYWVRRVTSAQAEVIEAWGDDDNTTDGFQVPIWSNDNRTGSWSYVGEGLWDSSSSSFSACVDTKWQGYLNCDSEISIGTAPKEFCIYAEDQFGDVVDGLTFTAKKGNTYSSGYINNGKVTLDLATGTPADWAVSYSGAMTSWSKVGIDSSSYASSTTTGCDFDLNVTVDNPYSAQVYVFARDENNVTIPSAYVTLKSNNYRDYYNKSAYTNTKGYTIFKVKPNVAYTAGYIAGTSPVNVNGSIVAPETADSGKYASVDVKNVSLPPVVYVTARTQITDKVEKLPFYISASDANRDTLTLNSLKLDTTTLVKGIDYNVTYTSSYAGHLYIRGILDLNSSTVSAITPHSLDAGTYILSAEVSDGKLATTATRSFNVSQNRAPIIGSLYLYNSSTNRYYYANSAIPVASYQVSSYAYDPDGDVVTKTIKVDGAEPADINNVDLAKGDHNITVEATDGTLTSTKSTIIYVGNHAPVISSAGATSYLIDINRGDTFKLFVYANDAENSPLTVTATDDANVTHTLSRVSSYGSKYESNAITLTDVKAQNNFTIVANDGEDNSTSTTVSVESIAANQIPIFTKELSDAQVNINEEQTFECEATDPEGTHVSYVWALNDVNLSESGTTYTKTFTSTGANSVSCTAIDADGKSANSTASILVVDPSVSSTFTVHARYEGLIVTTHNPSNYKVTNKKFTDANGDATFTVTGDRVTFGLTAWPDMEIHKNLMMDLTKPGMIDSARYNTCEGNTSTECTTADWCAMMEADEIQNWVWDADVDEDGTKPPAADVDTNNDGKISSSELYTAALAVLDAQEGNNDGKLSYAEVRNGEQFNRSVNMEIYANVPAREYYLYLNPFDEEYDQYQKGGYDNCAEHINFNSIFTIDYTSILSATTSESSSKDVYVSGSGYGSVYNTDIDANNEINVSTYTYYPGSNGKFTYLVKEKNHSAREYNYYLLNDKTQAEMEANVTIDASQFVAADKNVSFVKQNNNESFYLYAIYNGIYMDNSVYRDDQDGNDLTQTRGYFTDSGFIYYFETDKYTPTGYSETYNYYGDNSLQNSYNIADYPFLDVTFNLNSNDKSWTLSGNDMSKLSVVSSNYHANSSKDDDNGTIYHNLSIITNWTIAPSQMPSVVLQDIVPSEAFADANATVSGDNFYDGVSLDAEEFKGMTETSLLDLVAGNGSTAYSGEGLWDGGVRSVSAYSDYGPELSSASTETQKTKKAHSIFTIKLNASNAFTK